VKVSLGPFVAGTEVPMKKRSDREAVIDAVLADLRRELASKLPGEHATLEQIEEVAHQIGLELQLDLRQHLAMASEERGPEWFPEVEEAIRQLTTMSPNWNSYGARAVQPLIIQLAIKLLREIVRSDTPRPSVGPTARGGVQLEWHMRGIDLEIELDLPNGIHVLYEDAAGEEEWDLEPGASREPLASLMARLSPPE
jgi:hypothetical protein